MPFLETEKEIPMNPRQMHFINVLVVAYGRIDGQQSNKNSQLWFYKMLLFFECWEFRKYLEINQQMHFINTEKDKENTGGGGSHIRKDTMGLYEMVGVEFISTKRGWPK